MKIKKILSEPLLYLLPLLAVLYLMIIPAKMGFSDIKVTRGDKIENIKLPYSVNMADNEEFSISFNLFVENKKFAKFSVVPDDCIQEILINGNSFPLNGIKGLCDYSGGAYFDFSKDVQEGLNSFEFKITNGAGPGGLRIEMPYNGLKSLSLMHYVFGLFLLLSIAFILRKFEFKLIPISIILLGVAARLVAYTYISPTQYAYDIGGHLEYMQIIADENRIPRTDECWSCNHPPLYYAISAGVKKIVDNYDSDLSSRILQQGQMLLSIASLVLGMALLINLFGSRFAYLAALVLAFWPHLVVASPRLGNDVPFYFGALLCMQFAQRYWRFRKNSDMLFATIGAAIALMAKSTGLVILGSWIVIYVFCALSSFRIGSLRTLFASAFIALLSIGLSNHRPIVDFFSKGDVRLVNTLSASSGLKVENSVGSYFYFDLRDYLLEPYTSTWTDNGGRQYFWNFALKTSLFGEYRVWNAPVGYVLATMLNILVLFIFIFALWGIIHFQIRDFPPLIFLLSLFASLIFARAWYSFGCLGDFRYILPALYPLVYFSIRGIQILQDSRLRKLSYISMFAFAGLSLMFVVGRAI